MTFKVRHFKAVLYTQRKAKMACRGEILTFQRALF